MAYEPKTKATAVSVDAFIDAVENPARRDDARQVLQLMAEVSGEPPTMWGPSMIGYGKYRYVYDSGHSGEAMVVGFSPRKANLVLYVGGEEPERQALLARLGKHKTGKSCVYVNRLADIDQDVLRDLTRYSIAQTRARYPD